jgi:hypothetical protein
MATGDVHNSRRGRGAALLVFLAAVLVLAVALAARVAPPLMSAAQQALSGLIVAGVQAAAAGARVPYEMACQRVLGSGDVRALVGEPFACAPLEEVEWIGESPDQLEFTFKVTGPIATAEAHAIARTTNMGIELARVEVTGQGDEILVLPPP